MLLIKLKKNFQDSSFKFSVLLLFCPFAFNPFKYNGSQLQGLRKDSSILRLKLFLPLVELCVIRYMLLSKLPDLNMRVIFILIIVVFKNNLTNFKIFILSLAD